LKFLKKEFIEAKLLIKLRNLSFILFWISIMGIFFFDYYIVFYSTIFVSALIIFLMEDLRLFFSDSVYDGSPTEPSMYLFIHLLVPPFILRRIPLTEKSYVIKCETAGRIFTYISSSTLWFLLGIAISFQLLVRNSERSLLEQIKQASENPIDWKIVLAMIFFSILTIIFFSLKESIFEHYCKILISSENKKSKEQKRKLVEKVRKILQAVIEEESVDIDKLSKEVDLLEREIAYLNQEIEETREKFEFHRSLKLSISLSPISIPISALLARILELLGLL